MIRHRNVLANIVPVEREVVNTGATAGRFIRCGSSTCSRSATCSASRWRPTCRRWSRGTVIFTRSFNPHDILRLIRTRRVSVLVCVPKILDVLREHVVRAFPEAAEPPPPGISIPGRWWRYRRVHSAFGLKFWAFVVGAAPLPPDLEEFWRRMGFAVIQGYGLTETAPIVTLNHPFKTSKGLGRRRQSPASRSASPTTARSWCAAKTSRAATTAPSRTAPSPPIRAIDSEGWLHTGDIGERDAQGRLFIKGRKKEMIVTPEGLNVFPEDVERVLDELPGVRESAVVGVARDGEGTRARGARARTRHRRARDRRARPTRGCRITSASAPSSVWPDDAAAAHGRHAKAEARARFATGSLSGERRWPSDGDDTPRGAHRAVRARPRRRAATTTLEELGLSSLERVELMVALEDRFQTRSRRSALLPQARSVDDLKQLAGTRSPSRTEPTEPVDFPDLEPHVARRGWCAGCRWPRGFCRSRGCSRTRASRASST